MTEWDFENTITCNSDIDCEIAGNNEIYYRCAEFRLNERQMPGTTKVCLTSAMCEVTVVYGSDTASIVCFASTICSYFKHILLLILVLYSL